MRSWRSTLIAAVAIPTSIIATFAMMRVLDFTLNNVTMLALVLMVGVVIDDAIVVLENVFHCIEEKGMTPMQAAVAGTKEIGLAVLATTLSLVIVFLPVSFLSSVTGRMLFQFGMTATVAILVSMLVSFSLTPMMCSRLLRPVAPAAGGAGLAPRLLSLDRSRLRRLPALVDAAPLARAGALAGGDRLERAALQVGQAGLHPHERRRVGVRGQRHRAGRGDAPARWTPTMQAVEAEIRAGRRRQARC